MGLFDDDDYDAYRPKKGERPSSPPPQPTSGMRRETLRREILGRRQEREAGIHTSDVIRHELGLSNWSRKSVLALVVVVAILGAILWVKFGHSSIKTVVQDRLGIAAHTGTIRSVNSINTLTVSYAGHLHRIHLIGINPPKACVRSQALQSLKQALPRGQAVALSYDANLPKSVGGRQQVYLKTGSTEINTHLLQLGFARLASHLTGADYYQQLHQAQAQAQAHHRGLWACR